MTPRAEFCVAHRGRTALRCPVVLTKLLMSLLVLFVCAVLIYPTAYAFEFNYTLKTVLQYLQMALAVASVVCLWTHHPQFTLAGVTAVLLITAAILILNR